jgi:hypothetical protein
MLDITFPTFSELKQFIEENKKATICEIRNQKGVDVIINKQKEILAYGINSEFFFYLKTFIEEDYVVCTSDIIACLFSDSTQYAGEGKFQPIVLSIQPEQK